MSKPLLSWNPQVKPVHLDGLDFIAAMPAKAAEIQNQNHELLEAQSALEEARSRYFLFFDLAPVSYLVFDQAHLLVEANLTAADLFRVDREDLKQDFFVRFLTEGSRALLREHLRTVFATHSRRRIELKIWRHGGDAAVVEVETAYLEGSPYEQSVGVSAWVDVTQRRFAEQSYEMEHRLLRTLVDFLPDSVYVRDLAGRYLVTNGAYESQPASGHSPEALALEQEEDERVIRSGEALVNREASYPKADGQMGWSLTTKVPLRDAQGKITGLIGVSRDISEIKKVRAEQEQFHRHLEQTQKLESLGVLAGGIAHDFNNLLTAILGNTSLALLDVEGNTALEKRLKEVQNACVRASDLCKQMLAYSGEAQFNIGPVDLNAVIREITELLRVSINKRVALDFQLMPGMAAVKGDLTQLRQIVMNLVINASDAMDKCEEGVIRVATSLVQADHALLTQGYAAADLKPGMYVGLEVSDTGCGMTEETLGRVFEPFFTTKQMGRGLGLAAVLGIVRGHCGAVHVQSRTGCGTTFRILFPALSGASVPVIEAPPAFQAWRGQGTILVVDDEESIREIAAQMLRSFGFEVLTAGDGGEALVALHLHRKTIKMVLMDLTMPRMDGSQAFQKLREIAPELPILLMSGYTEHDHVPDLLKRGGAAFIEKPFEVEDLREKVRLLSMEAAGSIRKLPTLNGRSGPAHP